jgi:GNAT superfamily N-acetyltransferase
VIVRQAGVADAASLAALRDVDHTQLPAYTAWMAAHADSHLPFVAELNGVVVGGAWLHIGERVPARDSFDRHYGDIQSVQVREDHRNRGIGSALIAAILAEARARGLSHVTVHSSRRAVDFYLRNGFTHHRQMLLWEPE